MEPEKRVYEPWPTAIIAALSDPITSENIRRHLDALNAESAHAASQLLIEQALILSSEAKEALFLTADWLLEVLTQVDGQLGKTPLQVWRENSGRIDKEKLSAFGGRVRTAYSAIERSRTWEDRETATGILRNFGSVLKLFLEFSGDTLTELARWADFGKIRVALTSHFQRRSETLSEPAEPYDPVLLANLLGTLPSLVDYLLTALLRALSRLELPPEIFASAIFELAEEVDPQNVAELINVLASLTIKIHEGNFVVGGEEPRSKKFLDQYGRELSNHWDQTVLKQAGLAINEELKVVGKVISERVFGTPESTAQLAKTFTMATNSLLRGASGTVQRISALSPEVTSRHTGGLDQDLDVQELGRLLNSLAALFNKRFEQNTDSLGEILRKLLVVIENDQYSTAAKTLTSQLKTAVLAVPALSEKLAPEAVGEKLNQRLTRYNMSGKPDLSQVSMVLAKVDPTELSRALNNNVSSVVDVMLANPEVSRAIMKPLTKGFFRFVKGSIRMRRAAKRLGNKNNG